ncbi:magnesium transporter CorA family protein [Steroidobacter sp.]|uniref:magnesium transporter CorA family protein n=1 Tax=Steroidobacter sp. TaxID=1978227 RepID=UPI001A3682D9|nr:magnesium transporter CorA family protein [Steroidobacter sp.]MBL8269988.1 magnesium transporter CorA family protein [Steroidobacter sp.]
MLNIFVPTAQGLAKAPLGDGDDGPPIPTPAVWIDLLEPTVEEEKLVEASFGIEVPTREEMKEIETSNRLYEDNGALYMTTTVAAQLDTDRPISTAVTFILAGNRLITNRYLDTKPFQQFISYAGKHPASCQNAVTILAGLMEAFIERIADVLERVGSDLDNVSGNIFARNGSGQPTSRDLRAMIERIGFNGELNSKGRESLVSLGRLLMFVQQSVSGITGEQRDRFHSISRDVLSLSDHASFLGSKVSFLLEATLGLINVEQNNIIKIFSVAAVLFLPPTLIASIYGMNYHLLPDLPGKYSNFFFSIGLMIASMVVTYALFKRKGWL